ncbi:MAG: glycosyltransferase, partial [Planctomycetota bacterium]
RRQRLWLVHGVQMLPVQPFDQFNDLMNCADVHLLPQRAGVADLVMPSKLTGMLATGRPVVACAAAGTQICDVVAGRGLTVEPGDTLGFAQAIARLAENPEMRKQMEKEARRYAVEELSLDASLKYLLKQLDVLTGRRKVIVRTIRAWGQNVVNVVKPGANFERVQ